MNFDKIEIRERIVSEIYLLGGASFNKSDRNILTNTTSSGLLDISDKYKGIRYSTDHTAMIHASDSKIELIDQYENEIGIAVPDYIFSDFMLFCQNLLYLLKLLQKH